MSPERVERGTLASGISDSFPLLKGKRDDRQRSSKTIFPAQLPCQTLDTKPSRKFGFTEIWHSTLIFTVTNSSNATLIEFSSLGLAPERLLGKRSELTGNSARIYRSAALGVFIHNTPSVRNTNQAKSEPSMRVFGGTQPPPARVKFGRPLVQLNGIITADRRRRVVTRLDWTPPPSSEGRTRKLPILRPLPIGHSGIDESCDILQGRENACDESGNEGYCHNGGGLDIQIYQALEGETLRGRNDGRIELEGELDQVWAIFGKHLQALKRSAWGGGSGLQVEAFDVTPRTGHVGDSTVSSRSIPTAIRWRRMSG
ncbi:hypothetical protein B0H16DRAFT_1481344 [Mycena metata]|uniref:Uncharacterized protein n=1 Tax=Mycena metata TaxID=1033252 RepID=A0AAD7MB20_9AGAR|nr:hypothetical protein B0H16DRAFT_1481344 [Mycena metata]